MKSEYSCNHLLHCKGDGVRRITAVRLMTPTVPKGMVGARANPPKGGFFVGCSREEEMLFGLPEENLCMYEER